MSEPTEQSVTTAPDVSRELFEKALLRASRNKTLKPSQVAALRLYAQLHFGLDSNSKSASEDDVQKFQIGAVIRQDGKLYRVTAVELEGGITLMPFDPTKKFEVTAKGPDTESTKPAPKPAEPVLGSPRERAAAARLRALEHCKANPKDEFAPFSAAVDFEDGPEPGSSRFDFSYWSMRAFELKLPFIRPWMWGDKGHEWPIRWSHLWGHARNYDPQTGLYHFEGLGDISISEVRDTVEKHLQGAK